MQPFFYTLALLNKVVNKVVLSKQVTETRGILLSCGKIDSYPFFQGRKYIIISAFFLGLQAEKREGLQIGMKNHNVQINEVNELFQKEK